MYLSYSDIPGYQNLFLDYLQEYYNVARFYGRNFRAQETYEDVFKNLSQKEREHRSQLTDIIRLQYSDIKTSKQTQFNIEALYSNRTIAVVTGQQLGIFGGPLYTLFKAITAIKLCNYLKDKYDSYHFIPIFWLEGDDHDFNEARSTFLLDNENSLIPITYDDGKPEDINRGSIGELKFNQNLENIFNQLTSGLRETEYKKPLMDFISSMYQPNRTFLQPFREMMISLFNEYGLIIFNPLDHAIKKLLTPIFYKEITGYRDHTGYLVVRSAELEETYHAQVKVKPINLFYIDGNERLLIEPVDNEFRLKGKRKRFSQDDLLTQLNFAPERFSPNVLLRPICQDFLFPTAFYVGGPSEISYFAQLSPLYQMYNIVQPFIYPRASATIVEKGVKSIMDKFNLSYVDIYNNEEAIISKIVTANSDIDFDKLFNESWANIESTLMPLNEKLITVDKTLADLILKSKDRIEQTLDYLKTKTIEAEKRKHEATIRQISKVRNVLYPNNNLQERELNWIYFANKYGMDILKWIFNELTINKFEHQILEL